MLFGVSHYQRMVLLVQIDIRYQGLLEYLLPCRVSVRLRGQTKA